MKKYAYGVMAVFAVAVLAGCGSSKEEAAVDQAADMMKEAGVEMTDEQKKAMEEGMENMTDEQKAMLKDNMKDAADAMENMTDEQKKAMQEAAVKAMQK